MKKPSLLREGLLCIRIFPELLEIVLCHDRFSAGKPVFCVFVEAEGQIGAGDIVYVPEAAGGKDAAGVVAALAGAAVKINRTVLRDFVQAVTDL
mgnify:CR=1 FL=1